MMAFILSAHLAGPVSLPIRMRCSSSSRTYAYIRMTYLNVRCASGRGAVTATGARMHVNACTTQNARPSVSAFVSTARVAREVGRERLQQRPSGSVVTQAIFGVGAPEAVLVGVVALVLFGPKGLAQAAKSFGQVVKSVAPTLRELTDISSDLKNTIDNELGIREIQDELQETLRPLNTSSASSSARSRKDTAVEEDPDIEAKRAASMKAAWGGASSDEGSTTGAPTAAAVNGLSTEELERIIAERKAAQGGDGGANSEA